MTARRRPRPNERTPDFGGDKDLEREYWEEVRRRRRLGSKLDARAEKDAVYISILNNDPQVSTRDLAKLVRVTEKTAAKTRKRLERFGLVPRRDVKRRASARSREIKERLVEEFAQVKTARETTQAIARISAKFSILASTIKKYLQDLRDDGLVPRSARGAKLAEKEELKAMQPPPDAVAEDDVPGWVRDVWEKNDGAGLLLRPDELARYCKILTYKLRGEDFNVYTDNSD